MYALYVLLPLLAAVGVYAQLVKERPRVARFTRRLGLWSLVLIEAFVALFVIGETLDNPGGAKGAGMVAAWLVPALLLSALAWWKPDPAVMVLGVLAALSVTLGIVDTAWPRLFRDLQDQWGPVVGVVGLATGVAVTVLAFKRLQPAALILLLLGVVPAATGLIGNASRGVPLLTFGSSEALAAPMLIGGVLLALAAWLERAPAPVPSA